MDQVYMTAKLNLADGTILYPQVSLDNIVASISDPTLVSLATTTNGKVPVTELPVVTVVGAQGSNNNIPTEAAVRALADTKQNTLVAGTGTEIINGSTINAMAVNLNDVVVNNVPNNGLSLEVEGNTMSVIGELAANGSAGVIAGATNGVKLVDGVAQFDNTTVDSATPADIIAGTANKVIQADDLDGAMLASANIPNTDMIECFSRYGYGTARGSNKTVTWDEYGVVTYTGTIGSGSVGYYIGIYFNNLPNVSQVVGSWLVSWEIYIETASVTDARIINAYTGNMLTGVTGATTTVLTTTTGSWVRLGGVLVQGASDKSGPGLQFRGPDNTTITARIRNFRITPLASIPEANRAAWLDNDGYVYEPGAGILVNGRVINIDEATTTDTLNGKDSDGALIHDKTLTPGALLSALSTGQAVDCTAVPWVPGWTIYTGDSTSTTTAAIGEVYRDTFTLKRDITSGTSYFGFHEGYQYPKAGQIKLDNGTKIPLQYLFTCEITNNGTTNVVIRGNINTETQTEQDRNDMWSNETIWKPGETRKISFIFPAKFDANDVNKTRAILYISGNTTAPYSLTFSKVRQFEVMGLTDDARMHLAEPNTDVTDVNSFYLIKNDMVDPWVSIIDMGSAPSITIASGLAYKATVVSGATTTLSTDTVPANTYGKDAHMSLFVGATGTVICQPPLNLITPLTPGAGHNITIKYRDGQANMYVDDTDIGYVVSVAEGTDQGTFIYGYTTSTSDYIVFAPGVDESTISLPDNQDLSLRAVNVLGNGPENTIITGSSVYSLNSNMGGGVTPDKVLNLSNLTLKDVSVDTVEGSNGFYIGAAANCVFDNVSLTDDGGLVTTTPLECRGPIVGSTVTNCHKSGQWYSVLLYPGPMQNCLVTGNTCNYGAVQMVWWNDIVISGSTFTDNTMTGTYSAGNWGVVLVAGSGTVSNCYFNNPALTDPKYHGVMLESTATVGLSGNTFASTEDDIWMRGTASVVYFNGDNIVGSTVHGYGTVVPANGSHTDGNGTGVIDLADMQEKTLYRLQPQNVELSNITIKNGQGKAQGYFGAAGTKEGGGLYLQGARTSDLYSVVLRNVTITGCTAAFGSAIGITERCWVELYNCCFEGNYSTYHDSGAAIYDGALFFGGARNTHDVIISGCTFGADQNISVIAASANFKFRISGYNYCKNTIRPSGGGTNPWVLEDNTTIDMTGSAYNVFFDQAEVDFFIGNNVTFKGANGGVGTIDACLTHTVYATRPQLTAIEITAPAKEPWIIKDMAITLNVDAHAAYTMKYVGRNWQSGRYVSPLPARIQIAANAIMDLRSNSNSVIWAAGLMVVGDDVTAPSGSAGVCAVDGSTSNISGIGTYIGANGANDFVPLSSIVTVSTADGLSSALTGSGTWIQLDSAITGFTATYAADTSISGKNLITGDYRPIISGSYSLTANTVMKADNEDAAVIITGGALTLGSSTIAGTVQFGDIVDVDGTPTQVLGRYFFTTSATISGAGPDATIYMPYAGPVASMPYQGVYTFKDLTFIGAGAVGYNAHLFAPQRGTYTFTNVTFKDFLLDTAVSSNMGAVYHDYISTSTWTNCKFIHNSADYGGAIIIAGGGSQGERSTATITDCVFEDNTAALITNGNAMYITQADVTMSGCTFSQNQTIGIRNGTDTLTLTGYNQLAGVYGVFGNSNAYGTVQIVSGSTVKLAYASNGGIDTKTVRVGSYQTVEGQQQFVVGGTATVILSDGSTHHVSGEGGYINSYMTSGVFTDLTQID